VHQPPHLPLFLSYQEPLQFLHTVSHYATLLGLRLLVVVMSKLLTNEVQVELGVKASEILGNMETSCMEFVKT